MIRAATIAMLAGASVVMGYVGYRLGQKNGIPVLGGGAAPAATLPLLGSVETGAVDAVVQQAVLAGLA